MDVARGTLTVVESYDYYNSSYKYLQCDIGIPSSSSGPEKEN